MNWQTTPADKAMGALKSAPDAFESYSTAPADKPEVSEAVSEGEQAATAPRNFSGGVPTDNYKTV